MWPLSRVVAIFNAFSTPRYQRFWFLDIGGCFEFVIKMEILGTDNCNGNSDIENANSIALNNIDINISKASAGILSKKRRYRSWVYAHFHPLDESRKKYVCDVCAAVCGFVCTTMARHLTKRHGIFPPGQGDNTMLRTFSKGSQLSSRLLCSGKVNTSDELVFSHVDGKSGDARMVDVGVKPETLRKATAKCEVHMPRNVITTLTKLPKGDALAASQVAGIMAAKQTSSLLPLCHPLRLTHVNVQVTPDEPNECVQLEANVSCIDRTGCEMEALTAVTVAALCLHDMVKSATKDIQINAARVTAKSGGKSDYVEHQAEAMNLSLGPKQSHSSIE